MVRDSEQAVVKVLKDAVYKMFAKLPCRIKLLILLPLRGSEGGGAHDV